MSLMRSKRDRKAPERLGAFASAPEAEELEEPQRKRVAAAAAASAAAAELDSQCEQPGGEAADEEEEGSEEEEEDSGSDDERESSGENEMAATAARRPAKRRRTAAAAKPYVPAPPAEPRSRGDMLSLLFACPALIDALLEADGLRTISLVARDAANLAAALGARGAEAAPLWRQMACRCQPDLSADANAEQERAAILRGIRGDIARKEVVNKSTAQGEFRLTQKELGALPFTTRRNMWFGATAPDVKMYNKLEVLAVAHRKFGCAAGLASAKAAAGGRAAESSEARQARKIQQEARRRELDAALRAVGLTSQHSHELRDHKPQIKAFIKRNRGSVAGILELYEQQRQAAEAAAALRAADYKARLKRREKLMGSLFMANLTSERERPPALAFVSGEGSQSVAEVVATLRADKAARQAKAERAERVKQLLAAEGLEGYRGRVPSVAAFENSGVGSAEAAVAETRAQRDREKGSVARSAAICARLEAEGLQGQHHDAAVTAYICSGEGSEEAAVAAARGAAAAAAAAADAVVARRTRVNELLAAEDLEGCASRYGAPAVHDFIRTGEGTAEAAVAAVRAVAERCTAIAACLQSEGLQQYNHVAAVQQYVRGDGSEEAALAAARAAAERVQQVQARRASITGSLALMAAEGETFHELCWRVPGLEAFVYDGAGSEAETLAAVSRVLRAEADQRKRRERVDAALAAEGLQGFVINHWETGLILDKYLEYGEGTVEGVVAAARKRREEEAALAARRAARQAEQAAAQAAAAAAAPHGNAGAPWL
ncbi:hypothetical protein C2E20_2762 [Micractinium conductrix]|uniref:Uncharacterized protein n=1 Tax=Micractinium conductrix TaxID=554055 RepID=A0A2P6VJN8_9CHLO|nr:hypothetical protein C2E20_2762 [Micractinium conductrix]|eukprot:PSC74321.1 hypothetical protein C2E20_2762 [Micractinium conductrix]